MQMDEVFIGELGSSKGWSEGPKLQEGIDFVSHTRQPSISGACFTPLHHDGCHVIQLCVPRTVFCHTKKLRSRSMRLAGAMPALRLFRVQPAHNEV